MRPELLAPAGNMEKLQTALDYGADAVYCGVEQFSLRAQAGNLTLDELAAGCDYAHQAGKRLYLTLNAFLRPGEEASARNLLQALRPLPVDAFIVADPGLLRLVREIDPQRTLHLSTQANTTNGSAAQFWQSLGVKRLNLARELSLAEIAAVRAQTDAELEVFIHGAMCMAYSGRCLLSAALSGRSANRGNCSHPCRWRYTLQEETRPGTFLPIEEDARGTYLFNSRDLCLIDHLPALIDAGVNSLKIEGRMKSLYYVAAVTRVYRAALDSWAANPAGYRVDPGWSRELAAVSHRPYGTGFLLGEETAFVHAEDSLYRRSCEFVGVVRDMTASGEAVVEGRNRFRTGDRLEVIGPGMRCAELLFDQALGPEGQTLTTVQPNATVTMMLPPGTRCGDLLRRWRTP
ncbi:MAG: U32 family peptidase [Desulfuromonadales bacterium]